MTARQIRSVKKGEWMRTVLAAATLFLLVTAWRLSLIAHVNVIHNDENAITIRGMHEILSGRPVVYAMHSAYMGPLQEYASAALAFLFGVNLWTVRLPVALLSGLGIAVLFLCCKRVLPFWQAFTVCAVTGLSSSAVTLYTLCSVPSYGTGWLLNGLVLLSAFHVNRARSAAAWTIFGLVSGVSAYILPPTQAQTGVCLLWLAIHSEYARELWAQRGRLRGPVTVLAVAALPAILLFYHAFTRIATYRPHATEIAAIVLTLAAGSAALLWIAIRVRPRASACGCVALWATLFVAMPLPARLYYRAKVLPQLEAQGVKDRPAPSAQLKHAHEWKQNLALYSDAIGFQLLFGRSTNYMFLRKPDEIHFTVRSVATALVVAMMAVGIMRLASARERLRRWPAEMGLLLASLPLTVVAVFPTWLVSGDASLRYFIPQWWGFWLIVWIVLFRADERPWPGWRQWIFVAAGVLYAALDCFQFLPHSS